MFTYEGHLIENPNNGENGTPTGYLSPSNEASCFGNKLLLIDFFLAHEHPQPTQASVMAVYWSLQTDNKALLFFSNSIFVYTLLFAYLTGLFLSFQL